MQRQQGAAAAVAEMKMFLQTQLVQTFVWHAVSDCNKQPKGQQIKLLNAPVRLSGCNDKKYFT